MNCLALLSQSHCPRTAALWGAGGRARSGQFWGLAGGCLVSFTSRDRAATKGAFQRFAQLYTNTSVTAGISTEKSVEIFPNTRQNGDA